MLIKKQVEKDKEWLKLKQDFLVIKVTLSLEDYQNLVTYQRQVCKQLEWVELDPAKMRKMIIPIIESGYLHDQNYIDTLRMIIRSYYMVRSQNDWRLSDDRLSELVAIAFKQTKGQYTSIMDELLILLDQEVGQHENQ
ncbi:MAG: DUF6323 family protein [Beduini sp.]|uniref:DUF6323 family protein n=1 Tax=Beduini sp. TaxID=1922300 RepID=UPI0039A2D09B